MESVDWQRRFRGVYDRAVEGYRSGGGTPGEIISPGDTEFLASIGCSPQELFDFAEDRVRYDDPSFEDVLEVTAIRREYFLNVLQGRPAARRRSVSEFPAKTDAVEGIAWLPRLIVKARAKLRGEMPDELMYGCGGDRPFLRGYNLTLGQFLTAVRDAGEEDRPVIEMMKSRSGRR